MVRPQSSMGKREELEGADRRASLDGNAPPGLNVICSYR